jgi:hypothetical protein
MDNIYKVSNNHITHYIKAKNIDNAKKIFEKQYCEEAIAFQLIDIPQNIYNVFDTMDNIVNDVNLLPTLEELEELAEILLSDIKEYEREQEREAIQIDKENREEDLFDYYCLSLQK